MRQLADYDTDEGGSDLESQWCDEPMASEVTVHIYDSNVLPSSFAEELNSDLTLTIDPSNIGLYTNENDIQNLECDSQDLCISMNSCDAASVSFEPDTIPDPEQLNDVVNIPQVLLNKVTCTNDNNMIPGMQSDAVNEIFDLEEESTQSITPKRRGRKRFKDTSLWQKEIRKRKRQAGEEYIGTSGKHILGKKIKLKKDCDGKCRYKCGKVFNNEEKENIHRTFWTFNDDKKAAFFLQTTKRQINENRKTDSRRKYTYNYFFLKEEDEVKVCKDFYFGVLGVDDSRVRLIYQKLDACDGVTISDRRGKNTKCRTPDETIAFVRQHIDSFPRVQSHYCRSSTQKEYLEPGLSVAIMYDMYVEKCNENQKTTVKQSMYRKIFNKEFNILFHKPRKDRCDHCERMHTANANNDETSNSNELIIKYNNHVDDKENTQNERNDDRKDTSQCVICFDLQNVITLPRADVKNFFYKRKLNTYNLTAHCSTDKAAYNAIWTELEAGRGGNEIASALVTILHAINEAHPEIKAYTLWSDACVPQNKNSVMSAALMKFLQDHNVDSITQKFGCP